MSGRARDGRLVHFLADRDGIRPGDYITVTVTGSAPHYLLADSGVTDHRRTRAGDMWEAGRTPTTAPIGVGLGLPSVRQRGAQLPIVTSNQGGCGCE